MCWLYSPVLEGSSSECSSPSPEPGLYVLSSGKPSLRPASRAIKLRPGLSILSGTIYRPSTAQRGVAAWISSLRASRASRSVSPDSSEAPRTSDGSGPRSSASCESQSLLPFFSNAPRACGVSDYLRFSGTLPSSGSMQSGAISSQPSPSAHRTRGVGSSYSRGEYPTPAASAYGKNQGGGSGAGTGPERPSLEQWARKLWPTATAMDSRSSGAAAYSMDSGRHAGTTLTDAGKQWATQTARDWKDGSNPSEAATTNGLLGRQAPRTTIAGSDGSTPEALPRLSPAFVEALLGLPAGLSDPTGSTLSATEWCLYLRRWRCELSRLGQ